MELDINVETDALRRKSPWRSRRILNTAKFAVVLSAVFFAVGFSPGINTMPSWWVPPALGLCVLVVCSFIGFKFWKKNKILIDSGQIKKAILKSIYPFPRGLCRVSVEFELNGQTHKKSFVLDFMARDSIEQVGYLMIVVSPDSPKLVESLHMFAHSNRESAAIIAGKRGLAN